MILSIGGGGAIIKDQKILLTKRVGSKLRYPNKWTFPAGRYDEEDGSIEITAIREVKEEVGLDFKPSERLNFYESNDGTTLTISHIFLGTWSGDVLIQEEEVSEYDWFSYDESLLLETAFAYDLVIKDLYEKGLIM